MFMITIDAIEVEDLKAQEYDSRKKVKATEDVEEVHINVRGRGVRLRIGKGLTG